MAETCDIVVDQGQTWKLVMFATDEADAVVNLTGYSARMFVKKNKTDVTPLLQLTTANSKIVITPLTGRLDFLLLDTETDALTAGANYYDVEIVSPGGEVTRIAEGLFYVNQGVTR